MKAGLRRLGLSALAAGEFINNGIDSLERLRLLSKEDLDRLIKQIHRDNAAAGGAGILYHLLARHIFMPSTFGRIVCISLERILMKL